MPEREVPHSADLELAVSVLASLLRGEYSDRFSLGEIVSTWGDLDDDEMEAFARVEAYLNSRSASSRSRSR